jgi:hypothetical protein
MMKKHYFLMFFCYFYYLTINLVVVRSLNPSQG